METKRTIKPLKDKVFAKMIDGFGLKTTKGGLIYNEKDGTEGAIRPRWFEITHVGPKNKDFNIGDYVLVSHGRWSRGFKIDPLDETKYYMLDLDEILLLSDEDDKFPRRVK